MGPFFIEGRLTGKKYLKLLQQSVVPALAAFGVEWFQQDGASPHYAKVVRRYLNKAMPGRWIGRGSPAQSWPVRSPDLTPPDFWLWGHLKARTFETPQPTSLVELRQRIVDIFEELRSDEELPLRVCQSAVVRLEECLEQEGRPVRHRGH